jgi:hypothetical protein
MPFSTLGPLTLIKSIMYQSIERTVIIMMERGGRDPTVYIQIIELQSALRDSKLSIHTTD